MHHNFEDQGYAISARTVERRVTDMATDVTEQQTVAYKGGNVFSITLDESMDMNDISRLAVVSRYCSKGEVYEELCRLKPMYGTLKGKNKPKILRKEGIDLKKIFSVTTDGAPAMMGQHRGFVTLVEQKIGYPVMKLHCIIHQKNIGGKISNSALNVVMLTVTKIVSFLVARSAATHRQFRSLLEDINTRSADRSFLTGFKF